MKTFFRLFVIVVVGAMIVADASADNRGPTGFIIAAPSSPIRLTSQEDAATPQDAAPQEEAPQEEATTESPSDVDPVLAPPVPLVADVIKGEKESGMGKDCDGGKGCGGKGCGLGCSSLLHGCEGKPWGLPQPCLLQNRGIKVGGWLQQGVTFNNHNSPDGFNGPVATNDFDGEYQMNQLWFYVSRPVDTGGCGWDIGGHVDAIFGTDWRFGINNGLETEINGFNGQSYGLVIPQAYLELAYNDVSVKVGHYAAILDYEAVPAPMNPFYSHSYSYGYTVPQLVTGALANWKLNDRLSLQGGFHRGWSQFEDNNDKLDAIAGFKWQACDKRTSIAWAFSSGCQWGDGAPPFVAPPVDENNRFVYSLVIQHQFTDRFKYVLVHNVGLEENIVAGAPAGDAPPPPAQDAEWYGINQYFLYSVTKCLSANLRAEWMRDDDGRRIAGPGNIAGVRAWNGFDNAGDFFGLTAGLNWRPTSNWIVRPEIRYDWFDGPAGMLGLPFGGGTRKDQTTMAIDAVLLY